VVLSISDTAEMATSHEQGQDMDTATALWAAAIGAGTALATVVLFGALAGRRFRKRARSRGFDGPPWAFAAAHGHGPGHRHGHDHMHMHGGGPCGRRGPGERGEATDAAAAEQAEA
jgi:hypothetical protein